MMETLRKFDFFAIQISLSFNKNKTYGTLQGFVLSLIVIGINIAYTYNLAQELWLKQNPILSQSSYSQPEKLFLKDYPITIGFINAETQYISIEQNLQLESYFSNIGYSGNYYESSYRPMVTCDKKLGQFSQSVQLSQLFIQQAKGFYCIDFEQEDFIIGEKLTEESQQISFQIQYCKGEHCQNENEMQKFVDNVYGILIYFPASKSLNSNDYLVPFKMYPQQEYKQINNQIMKIISISIGKQQLKSDNGILLSNWSTESGYIVQSQSSDFHPMYKGVIATFQFSGSGSVSLTTRVYMKIPDVLAKVMGIFGASTAIIIVLAGYYQQFQFKYDFYQYLMQLGCQLKVQSNGKIKIENSLEAKLTKNNQSIESQLEFSKNNHINQVQIPQNQDYSFKSMILYQLLKLLKNKKHEKFKYCYQIDQALEQILSLEGIFQMIYRAGGLLTFQINQNEEELQKENLDYDNLKQSKIQNDTT